MRKAVLFMLSIIGVTAFILAFTSVFTIPSVYANLVRFNPKTNIPQEPTNLIIDPYRIEAGTYTIKEGTASFTLKHPLTEETTTGETAMITGIFSIPDTNTATTSEGTIVVDMASLLFSPDNAMATYARSSHIFDIENHKNATLSILKMEKIPGSTNRFMTDARMEMRGQSHDITFPATIFMRDETLRIEADFSFDRTQWGMTYASASMVGENATGAIADTVLATLSLSLGR